MDTPNKKVLVAMSGGVDSTVTAKILLDHNYDCIGATMLLCPHADQTSVVDAQKVAKQLGIPHHVYDYKKIFEQRVIQPFVDAYLDGLTPNPCIACNHYLKFGQLLKCADELGIQYLSTGHYARIDFDGEKYYLKKATDVTKDQSYFLYHLDQEALARVLFPLGNLSKSQTRQLAEQSGLVNANKPDSQDICFVPDGDYVKIVTKYSDQNFTDGNIVDRQGNVLGKHHGIINYTIGQRKGLGLAVPKPLYVCGLDVKNNEVVVGSADDVFCQTFYASDFNWLSGEVPTMPLKCMAKIRYAHREQPATVTMENKMVKVTFEQPQRAVTPGQAVVLYDGDIVIGGGTILK